MPPRELVGMDYVSAARLFAEYAQEAVKRAPKDGEIVRWMRGLSKEQLMQYASAAIFVADLAPYCVNDLLEVLAEEHGINPEGLRLILTTPKGGQRG